MTSSPKLHRQRRRSVLIVLLAALTLSLVPHPKGGKPGHEHFKAVAQETHGDVLEAENTCISMMLLGCMGFMMATFYLVNWPDDDIRRISWEVISSTISVFGSLLLFQSSNRVLEYYFFHDMSIWQHLAVAMLQLLLWFGTLQLVLAYYSGAIGEHHLVAKRQAALTAAESSSCPKKRREEFQSAERCMHEIRLNTHAAATLMGHVTGFAAVNAWGILQQAVPRSFWPCAMVPPLSFFGISWVYEITKYFRHKKTMADGEEDEYEELWGERVAETEDEVISLAVSFLSVQILRFCISGSLPEASGEDAEGQDWHSNYSCLLLLLTGVVAGIADVARLLYDRSIEPGWARMVSGESQNSNSINSEKRAGSWFQKISAMTFAFCLLFAAEWWISSNLPMDGSMKAVVSALLVTVAAFMLIFGIDKVADMHADDAELDEVLLRRVFIRPFWDNNALRLIISALGMLVGFSWERCFDAAVGGLSQGHDGGKHWLRGAHEHHRQVPAAVCNLILAVILAILVLPAWKWYILPGLHSPPESTTSSAVASSMGSSIGEENDVKDAESVRSDEPPKINLVVDLGDETRLFGRLSGPDASPCRHCKCLAANSPSEKSEISQTSWSKGLAQPLLQEKSTGLSSSPSLASIVSLERCTPRILSI